MTRAEAEAFVEEAKNLPNDQVDVDKLAEAIRVLSDAPSARVDLSAVLEAITRFESDLDEAVLAARKGRTEAFAESAAAKFFATLGDIRERISEVAAERTFTPTIAQRTVNPLGEALAIAERVADRGSTIRDQRAITGPGRETEPMGPGRIRGGGTPQSRMARLSATTGAGLDPQLRVRLFQAADRAGIPPAQVLQVIADAERKAGGELPPEIAAVYAASGEDVPTVEQILEDQIAEWTQGPIGVPEGFVAVRDMPIDPTDRRLFGGAATRPTEVLPQYFDGDQFNLAGLAPEKIVDIQKRLEAAGLIGEGVADYWSGVWDDTTAAALLTLMAQANRSGTTWEAALESRMANVPESVKEARNKAKLADQFQTPAFIRPDYASLAQGVKGYTRQWLGREPSGQEMAEMTAFMSGLYRQGYEAEVAAMRAEFEAGQQSLETGTFVTPASTSDVDEQARALEEFDRRFAPELRFIEDQEAAFENSQTFFRSVGLADALIGGR